MKKKIEIVVAIVIILIIAVSVLNKNTTKNEQVQVATSIEENIQALDDEVDTSKWDLTKVTIVYDTENIPVPVPIGFTASGADTEHTVNTGFVIYEGTEEVTNENAWTESINRNQFVWVPVKNASERIYESSSGKNPKKSRLYNFTSEGRTQISQGNSGGKIEPGVVKSITLDTRKQLLDFAIQQDYTKDIFYKELQIEFDKSMESIEKYNGFYIGRYETGDLSSNKPVIRRMNINVNNQTWYGMYNCMKNISDNENIQTSMIWGCLFDETLQWLIDTRAKTKAEIATDSTGWGNYEKATFTYLNKNMQMSIKSQNSKIIIPTGSSEYTKANNIYDLAGNVWDFTLESALWNRYLRGGYYSSAYGGNVPVH